jgi:GNAT superfamily N-acetyltransferase
VSVPAFSIRPAVEDDAPALATLIRGLGLFPRFDGEAPETTAARAARNMTMCRADSSHTVLVVEAGRQVVAYAAVHWLPYFILKGPEGYLSELFVAESHRGAGIGTALLDRVVEEGRSRGCARLMLEAAKDRESYRRGFYRGRGWTERPDMANFVYTFKAG